jgi:hypothetical protein
MSLLALWPRGNDETSNNACRDAHAVARSAERFRLQIHTNAGLASRFVLVAPRPLRPQLRGQIARRTALDPSPVSLAAALHV